MCTKKKRSTSVSSYQSKEKTRLSWIHLLKALSQFAVSILQAVMLTIPPCSLTEGSLENMVESLCLFLSKVFEHPDLYDHFLVQLQELGLS